MRTFNNNKLILVLSFSLIVGCTLFEVQAPVDVDIQVGPNTCDFVESFEAQPNPGWVPSYYNMCEGYNNEPDGSCMLTCSSSHDCDVEHYCVYEVGECFPRRPAGVCVSSEECLSNICMCDVCVDNDALIEFLGSAAIEALGTSSP